MIPLNDYNNYLTIISLTWDCIWISTVSVLGFVDMHTPRVSLESAMDSQVQFLKLCGQASLLCLHVNVRETIELLLEVSSHHFRHSTLNSLQ